MAMQQYVEFPAERSLQYCLGRTGSQAVRSGFNIAQKPGLDRGCPGFRLEGPFMHEPDIPPQHARTSARSQAY